MCLFTFLRRTAFLFWRGDPLPFYASGYRYCCAEPLYVSV
jgi:hypothetical protein